MNKRTLITLSVASAIGLPIKLLSNFFSHTMAGIPMQLALGPAAVEADHMEPVRAGTQVMPQHRRA